LKKLHFKRKKIKMVVIRLARGGAKKRPFYKIVVADSRNARDGRYLERLGYFNPIAKGGESRIVLEQERVAYWQSKGAQPSARVLTLLEEYRAQAAKEVGSADKKGQSPKEAEAPKSEQHVEETQ
jgi:small subunit ribosomal protein S16